MMPKRKMELMWCSKDFCKDAVRERVVGKHNEILLNGPATGQVAYHWQQANNDNNNHHHHANNNASPPLVPGRLQPNITTALAARTKDPSVFLLVKKGDPSLMKIAADAVEEMTALGINVLLDPSLAARLEHYHGVNSARIGLFEMLPTPGYGSELGGNDLSREYDLWNPAPGAFLYERDMNFPDLIVTLGGDGLLMHASMLFQGPVPPILCIAGGSLGFLTAFAPNEMIEAVRLALGMVVVRDERVVPSHQPQPQHPHTADKNFTGDTGSGSGGNKSTQPSPLSSPSPNCSQITVYSAHTAADAPDIDVFPPNTPSYPYAPMPPDHNVLKAFGGHRVCLSIRMRLDCCIMSRDGRIRARYNVLNEVVVDRGSSPYLAALECFCDDVHLTTVQADGVIFATPTGSTAYSLAAGSSVVHPAVPCILVTPICPHVLSFRSMVFPDHVVLRCYVPDNARAEASVAFDGKCRQELRRGESVQIQMSPYPVPTINRQDHSSDWLDSLKRNFNFNARPRQKPLT